MWGREEELPPFTVYFPGWMAGRHASITEMCEEWGIGRFAYQLPLPGYPGQVMLEFHEYENGEWV